MRAANVLVGVLRQPTSDRATPFLTGKPAGTGPAAETW
jgi:hypothetical protein